MMNILIYWCLRRFTNNNYYDEIPGKYCAYNTVYIIVKYLKICKNMPGEM